MLRPPRVTTARNIRASERGGAIAACAAAVLAAAGLATLCGCGAPVPPRAAFDPDTIPSAYARPSGALMWPGASRAFEITPAGDLYNGDWVVRVRPSSAGVLAGPPRVIASEDRWLPVEHWRRTSGPVRWEFEALALPEEAPRDTSLIVSIEVRATNTGLAPSEARLALRIGAPDPSPPFLAFDAPDSGAVPLRWSAGGTGEFAQGWSDLMASGDSCVASWTLAPGETRTARCVLPAYAAPARALASWARTPHARRAEAARRYWTGAIAGGAGFALGDPALEGALNAARVVLLACRERRGRSWVPIGNPFQYRDVWLRDGARAIQALAVCGHTREARELAEGFLHFQWPQGPFLSQRGQLDGTGQALWAFEQALLRPAPDDSVARYADAALRAIQWCEWQRDLGRQSGWPFGRMMPFGDPRDAELTRAQLVGNDAWMMAGYRAASRLLRAARRDAMADSVDLALARYRTDFLRALAISRSPDLPASWQGVGRDWGNLAAGWPCRALDPGDPRCAALARRVWAAAGGPGLTWYGARDSLQYYVGADLGTWALLTGRRAQADSVLDALLAFRDANGGAGELFTRSAHEFGGNLPPHATSAAALITLVRNALVFDDGDTLALTLGARTRWWTGATVSRAPTRWGAIDLAFRRDAAGAEWTWSAVPVWTSLTLPSGTRLGAPPPAPLRGCGSGRCVLAPPGTIMARVVLAADASAAP
jgi:hypothetical protein